MTRQMDEQADWLLKCVRYTTGLNHGNKPRLSDVVFAPNIHGGGGMRRHITSNSVLREIVKFATTVPITRSEIDIAEDMRCGIFESVPLFTPCAGVCVI